MWLHISPICWIVGWHVSSIGAFSAMNASEAPAPCGTERTDSSSLCELLLDKVFPSLLGDYALLLDKVLAPHRWVDFWSRGPSGKTLPPPLKCFLSEGSFVSLFSSGCNSALLPTVRKDPSVDVWSCTLLALCPSMPGLPNPDVCLSKSAVISWAGAWKLWQSSRWGHLYGSVCLFFLPYGSLSYAGLLLFIV